MVANPDVLLARYVEAGCELVIVHAETCTHLHRTLMAIHEAGARAGVALNPATPVDAVRHVLDLVDLLLVMTVNPGFGGQSYLPASNDKIQRARALLTAHGVRAFLEVDGGITPQTIAAAHQAGADTFVAGHAIFKSGDPARAVQELRRRCLVTV